MPQWYFLTFTETTIISPHIHQTLQWCPPTFTCTTMISPHIHQTPPWYSSTFTDATVISPHLHTPQWYLTKCTDTTMISRQMYNHHNDISLHSQTPQWYHLTFTDATMLSPHIRRHHNDISTFTNTTISPQIHKYHNDISPNVQTPQWYLPTFTNTTLISSHIHRCQNVIFPHSQTPQCYLPTFADTTMITAQSHFLNKSREPACNQSGGKDMGGGGQGSPIDWWLLCDWSATAQGPVLRVIQKWWAGASNDIDTHVEKFSLMQVDTGGCFSEDAVAKCSVPRLSTKQSQWCYDRGAVGNQSPSSWWLLGDHLVTKIPSLSVQLVSDRS